jgi:class 3 adenylate cyclase/predicted ATPase
MTYDDVLSGVIALLQREGRIAYRVLKRRFSIDEEFVEDLKADLIDAKHLAVDEDGKVLVWVGNAEEDKGTRIRDKGKKEEAGTERLGDRATATQPPVSYTPSHLAERIRAATVTDGERKTITALFADLKGSTALIEGLDPEEARAIIDPALQLMMDAVHRYEGYVAQALGDGIFALFGAPIAHEDHPQRALYAALRMQEEMRRYGDQVRLKHGVPLAMRVGINTGEVVVRSIRKDDLHADYVPVGHSTNLAARMEQLVAPGSILVTAYTHKLTEGYFAFKALGQTQVKGVEEPLAVYEVLGAGPLRTRLQVNARRGLTRFVGRQREMEQMQQALAQAKAGHGQIVGVMGEPGLGKSRLFYEFKLLSQSGCLLLEAYSVSHGKASPYLPVIELLKSYFRIEPPDDERTRQEKVTGKVLRLDRNLEDTLPYLFALLGIEEQPSPLQQMDPQIRRRRTFEALKKLFLRESLNQPLILIFEDLHWIDSETQGFLDTLSEGVASAKLLLLVNYRPEYRHDWGQKTYYTQLRLAPFGRAEAEEFLRELLGHEPDLSPLKQLILDKTEGTPFFMEEVVQTLVEDGTLAGERGQYTLTQSVTALQLPTTVQGVLAARIDRLAPDEKALLQQLAIIGREFPLQLVRQVITLPDDTLFRVLAALQHKEFLYEQPALPDVEYVFKHALTQEVAYNSVLIERRKALHEHTARAIEQLYHDRLEERYSELAHHYSRSNNAAKAVEYLRKTAQQAVLQSAYEAAETSLTVALDCLLLIPESSERNHDEIALQTMLGTVVVFTKGQAAPETGAAFRRAYHLCEQEGDVQQTFNALAGLRRFYGGSGDLEDTLRIASQMLTLAQQMQNPVNLVETRHALAFAHFWRGEFTSVQFHSEQGLESYIPESHHQPLVSAYGFDGGMNCHNFLACALWYLGYPQRAVTAANTGLSLARALAHMPSLSVSMMWNILLGQFRQDPQAIQNLIDELITVGATHGLKSQFVVGTILQGWRRVHEGHGEDSLRQLQNGINLMRASGQITMRPFLLALLAETAYLMGHREQGLAAIMEALAEVAKTGERFYEAELYRLKGELTLQKGARDWGLGVGSLSPQAPSLKPQDPSSVVEEAEGYFRKAINVAQQQHAKSLELRASVSLARLWQRQGKQTQAHQMLSEVYNWFTEGFDTKDLQEAKALVDVLE